MLLAIDMGNTQTAMGLFDGDELVQSWRMPTDRSYTADEIHVRLMGFFKMYGLSLDAVDAIAFAGVVPQLSREWHAVADRIAADAIVIGPQTAAVTKLRAARPQAVGADRVANAVAAETFYGAPAIVVDFGTATNIDVIDEDGYYIGGAIAPGIRISMLSGNSGQIEHALEEHAIDLGIVESMSRRQGLHYTLFAHDELVLITRTGGKYARTESLTTDALRHIPLVLREEGSGTLEVIAAALAAAGIRLPQLHVVMRLGTTEGIKSFVRNSDTMAIVSVISVVDCLRSGVLRIVDWEDLTMRRDFSFVHAETTPAPLAGQFIDFARANL